MCAILENFLELSALKKSKSKQQQSSQQNYKDRNTLFKCFTVRAAAAFLLEKGDLKNQGMTSIQILLSSPNLTMLHIKWLIGVGILFYTVLLIGTWFSQFLKETCKKRSAYNFQIPSYCRPSKFSCNLQFFLFKSDWNQATLTLNF